MPCFIIFSRCVQRGTPLHGNKIVTREKMAVSRDKNSLKLFSSSMYKMRTTARSFTHEAWLMLQNYLNYQPFSSDKMKLQFLITKTYYITYIGRNAVMEGSTFFLNYSVVWRAIFLLMWNFEKTPCFYCSLK